MSKKQYLTSPTATDGMPSGIPYIISNEFAERFSFYGMKGILVIFMTNYLLGSDGLDPMSKTDAGFWYHLFVMAVYFTPVIGSLISDIFFGKYLTIMSLSIVYCAGHIVLALDETRLGLSIGLTLIAIGAGGIKPCVSAHVGDQFGKNNQHLLQKVYGWFYLAINLGSFLSMLITPVLLKAYGPWAAFGLPGVLMILATWFFWLGRNKFVHIPAGGKDFIKESFSGEGLSAFFKVALVLLFTTPFWALFDQTGSSWITQAQYNLDLNFAGINVLPSQIQAANPFFIIIFIPILSYFIYPAVDKFFKMTAVRKICIGFFIGGISFAIPAMLETWIRDSYEITNQPQNGSLSGSLPNLFYHPNDGFQGEDTFTFIVKKDGVESEPATVRILVEPTGDQLRGGGQELNTDEGAPVTIFLGGYSTLKQVEDPKTEVEESKEAAPLKYTILDATPVYEEGSGEEIDNSNRKISHYTTPNGRLDGTAPILTFTPNKDYKGTDTFRYQVSGLDRTSEASTISISVDSKEDPPVACARTVATTAGSSVSFSLQGGGMKPSFLWQILACLFLTIAEIMISVTALEFAYTQAPNKMKSLIMFLYLLPMSLGNGFTAMVNLFIVNDDGSLKLEGPSYFWFFDAIIFITGILFIGVVLFYKEKTYIQETVD